MATKASLADDYYDFLILIRRATARLYSFTPPQSNLIFPMYNNFCSRHVGSVGDTRLGAGAAGNFARDKGLAHLSLHVGPLNADSAAAVVEGVAEGNYRYEPYLPQSSRKAA